MKFGELIKRHPIKIIATISLILVPLLILSVIDSEARTNLARLLFGSEASAAVIDSINWSVAGILGLGGLVTSTIAEEVLFRCKKPEEARAEEITTVLAGKNLIEDIDTHHIVAGMSSSRSSLDSLITQPEIFNGVFLTTAKNASLSSSVSINTESDAVMQTSSYVKNEQYSLSADEYTYSYRASQNQLSGSS